MNDDDRYARQCTLREVDRDALARIRSANVTLPAGPAATTAVAYLERAGVERVSVARGAPRRTFELAGHFEFAATRSVAEGAWLALAELRARVRGTP